MAACGEKPDTIIQFAGYNLALNYLLSLWAMKTMMMMMMMKSVVFELLLLVTVLLLLNNLTFPTFNARHHNHQQQQQELTRQYSTFYVDLLSVSCFKWISCAAIDTNFCAIERELARMLRPTLSALRKCPVRGVAMRPLKARPTRAIKRYKMKRYKVSK